MPDISTIIVPYNTAALGKHTLPLLLLLFVCLLLFVPPVLSCMGPARAGMLYLPSAALWEVASYQQAGNLFWPDFWSPFTDADKEDVVCDMLGLKTQEAMVRGCVQQKVAD